MNVLVVYPRMTLYGGAELLVVRLCNFLSGQGVKHTLLTTAIIPEIQRELTHTVLLVRDNVENPGKAERNTQERSQQGRFGLNPHIWHLLCGYTELFRDAFFLWKMVRIHQDEFDLINIHNYPATFAAFCCRKPVAWMCNEPEAYLRTLRARTLKGKALVKTLFWGERWIVRRFVQQVIVSDAFNAERFQRVYGITPQMIHYGIDTEFFSAASDPGQLRNELGVQDRFVILHAGMITPFKNQLESLKTLVTLKTMIPNVLLILAGHGEGQYILEVEQFMRDHALADHVRLTGHLNRIELRKYYQACDILLHPVYQQGGWLAPFEALCAGTPIIVSPYLTSAEIIRNERLGMVTEHYVETILETYRHPEIYREMALRGRIWVKDHLSWETFGREMLNLFSTLK
jgi:glycosyltransferase involved in cell wall biosynthesis